MWLFVNDAHLFLTQTLLPLFVVRCSSFVVRCSLFVVVRRSLFVVLLLGHPLSSVATWRLLQISYRSTRLKIFIFNLRDNRYQIRLCNVFFKKNNRPILNFTNAFWFFWKLHFFHININLNVKHKCAKSEAVTSMWSHSCVTIFKFYGGSSTSSYYFY